MSLPTTLPELRGEDVSLRAFREGDIRLIAEVAADPLIPLITSVPTDTAPDQLLAYIER